MRLAEELAFLPVRFNALAAPHGFVRAFLDYGAPMRQLLVQGKPRAEPGVRGHVTALIAAFPGSEPTLFLDEASLFRYPGLVAPKKLTPGEITSCVEKIRGKYDQYVSKFYKSRFLRSAFEDRYLKALKEGVDVSSFLLAEISAIEELSQREEDRIAAGPPQPAAPAPAPSFADRVLEENRKRIAKYPDFGFHQDANEEVRRLLGALADIYHNRWQPLGHALRKTTYSMGSSEMIRLDSDLRSLAAGDLETAPHLLLQLVAQLRRFPRNHLAVEREERDYMLAAAFFLNDLHAALDQVKRLYTDMAEEDRRLVEETMTRVGEIVGDFRLRELKRRESPEPR